MKLTPPQGAITVWWVALDQILDPDPALTSAERFRASQYRDERDRARFVAAHSAMRRILSGYTGVGPTELPLAAGVHGKPFLSGREDIQFNLTHSNAFAGLSVTRGAPLGLDCEFRRPLQDLERVCRHVCSPFEFSLLRGYPEARGELFYKIWTRKEAFVKALGAGLTRRLSSFTVLKHPHDRGARVGLPGVGVWWVWSISGPVGYTAACCAPSRMPVKHVWSTVP